jgi:hypothetical protein
MTSQEKFNPSDPKYKKVEDLPIEHRRKFKNVDDGFIRYETVEDINNLKLTITKEYAGGIGHNEEHAKVYRVSGKVKNNNISLEYCSDGYREYSDEVVYDEKGNREYEWIEPGYRGTLDGKELTPDQAEDLWKKYAEARIQMDKDIKVHKYKEEQDKYLAEKEKAEREAAELQILVDELLK